MKIIERLFCPHETSNDVNYARKFNQSIYKEAINTTHNFTWDTKKRSGRETELPFYYPSVRFVADWQGEVWEDHIDTACTAPILQIENSDAAVVSDSCLS